MLWSVELNGYPPWSYTSALWLDSARRASLTWVVIAGAALAMVILTAARASWIGLACGFFSLAFVSFRANAFAT